MLTYLNLGALGGSAYFTIGLVVKELSWVEKGSEDTSLLLWSLSF